MLIHIPLEHLAEIAPPKPSELQIDYGDADSLLRAAGVLEQHGEWQRAIELYKHAAQMLRGQQDALYAENCIKEVERKIARAKE